MSDVEGHISAALARYSYGFDDKEDIKQECRMALFIASKKYNKRLASEATYHHSVIKHAILNFLNKQRVRYANHFRWASSVELRASPVILYDDDRLIVERKLLALPEMHQRVIDMRYYQCLTLASIGKLYSMTRQRVHQIEKEALGWMK